MRHIYQALGLKSNYTRYSASRRFLKLATKSLSLKDYEILLENYMILIDEDIRTLYKKMNINKNFTTHKDVNDFLKRHDSYERMKLLIEQKLQGANIRNPYSVIYHLNKKILCPFSV